MAGKYIDQIKYWEPLLNIIRKAEASPKTDKTSQYDSIVNANPLPKLDTLPIKKAIELVNKERPRAKYIGAYQFNKTNLLENDSWVTKSGLTENDIFNSFNQDNIAIYLIVEIRGGKDWKNGTLSDDKFITNLAKEWAGLPVSVAQKGDKIQVNPGQSYYSGVNNNKANVTVVEVKTALNSIKLGEDANKIIEPNPISIPETTNPDSPILTEDEFLKFIDL